MTNHLPHPTAQAVEAAARRIWELQTAQTIHGPQLDAAWNAVTPARKHGFREIALTILTAVHDQYVTDVLQWETDTQEARRHNQIEGYELLNEEQRKNLEKILTNNHSDGTRVSITPATESSITITNAKGETTLQYPKAP